MIPAVTIIPCHLPDEQRIVFCEATYEEMLETCHSRLTEQLRYFMRARSPEWDAMLIENLFTTHTIPDQPNLEVYDEAKGEMVSFFVPTKRNPDVRHLAYLHSVKFGNRELFSLYTLLRHRAAHSFEELLSGCTSFYASCILHGYFSDGEHSLWHFALYDMAYSRMNPPEYMLRHFAHMLSNSGPTVRREQLFIDFWRHMVTSHRGSRVLIPDWMPGEPHTRQVYEVLRELQRQLAKDGIDLAVVLNFNDLKLDTDELLTIDELCETAQTLSGLPAAALAPYDYHRLTEEQMAVYEDIMINVDSHMRFSYGRDFYDKPPLPPGAPRPPRPAVPHNPDAFFYINGSAGTGKTYLVNTLIKHLVKDYRARVASCAMTGVAASLLIGGVTAHRLFGLPVEDCDPAESKTPSWLKMKSLGARMLREADVIIIDEFSVLHNGNFDKILKLLQEIQTICASGYPEDIPPDRIYGGKIFIFVGDFQQMTPVVPGAASVLHSAVLAATVCSHPIFREFCRVMVLTEPRRAADDPEFAAWLQSSVAQGDEDASGTSDTLVALPRAIRVYTPATIDAALSRYTTVIAPFNDTVQKYREKLTPFHTDDGRPLHRLEATYLQMTVNLSAAALEQENSAQLPPHILNICEGMPLMLLRNISVADGLCNGSVLMCQAIHSHTLTLVDKYDREHEIPRMQLAMTTVAPCTTEIGCYRIQFPVVPAFSITNNKSQGTTQPVIPYPPHRNLDDFPPPVILDLTNQVHTHGALYVGLSRVRGFKWIGVVVSEASIDVVTGRAMVRNVVYRDLLRMAKLLPEEEETMDPAAADEQEEEEEALI
jgi:hypothetical protein